MRLSQRSQLGMSHLPVSSYRPNLQFPVVSSLDYPGRRLVVSRGIPGSIGVAKTRPLASLTRREGGIMGIA
jgi:hypothetical protein